ncbi:MAG: isoprenylcysteine carboxylmethyltransferase family protein [Candidatus Limnocylindrales bacterium]
MSEPPSATPAADIAPEPVDERHLPALGPHGEGWFVLQIVFMVLVAITGIWLGSNFAGAPRFAASVAGGALIAAGIALGYLGIRDLDRSLSPLPRPRDTAVLIQDGVYRRLRHPIYAGVILLAIGWGLLMASFAALALALALALLLDLKARREEVWLRERYPGYAAYAQHTKRFVPGIY